MKTDENKTVFLFLQNQQRTRSTTTAGAITQVSRVKFACYKHYSEFMRREYIFFMSYQRQRDTKNNRGFA